MFVKRQKYTIKKLPFALRPREKLVANGAQNLSGEELLAILLGTGSKSQDVLSLSKELLKKHSLEELSLFSVKQFSNICGIGQSKATRVVAAFELGKRVYSPKKLTTSIIRSATDVLSHVRDIASKRQEYLLVFYLNARYELVQKQVIGQGSLNKMLITPKEVFAPAVQMPCAFLILVHNHPSGDPHPSDDDISFTEKIQEAGEIMGIALLDHVIVATHGHFSFRENEAKE